MNANLLTNAAGREFVFKRNYARWLPDKKRRETWEESVGRYCDFIFSGETRGKTPERVKKSIKEYISSHRVMPSMRAFWSAGKAAEKNNASIYNCSALPIRTTTDFAEAMFLLMSSCGVGISVEKKNINLLPEVPETFRDYPSLGGCGTKSLGVCVIEDTKESQADSIKTILDACYSGLLIEFDYSKIRKAGARLETSGGRASGAEPLKRVHSFIFDTMLRARGRKLTSLEVSDICNKIAENVEAGGVRRSAQIILTDIDDEDMAHTKRDLYSNPHRALANISAVYEGRPAPEVFLREFLNLIKNKTGERGIFNREAARKKSNGRKLENDEILTNPCGEIILKPYEFCNLSEIVVRSTDNLHMILQNAKVATWIGVLQSTFTDFTYLRPIWKENAENDRILGISITGIMDNPKLFNERNLRTIKDVIKKETIEACKVLGIKQTPKAATCIKPSGTVSQLVDSASGIHPRFAPYYIRRYIVSNLDPLYEVLRESGVKLEPAAGMSHLPPKRVSSWVVSFPIKSPEGSITIKDFNSQKQIDMYLLFMKNFVDHNVSTTIYVKDEEWVKTAAKVYEHFNEIIGLTFFPAANDTVYEKPPYEEITKEKYEEMVKALPAINYDLLSKYEESDETAPVPSLACSGNSCEL